MKKEMKFVGFVALTMVSIIAVQIGLTCLFTFRAGEIFSEIAVRSLFLYTVMRMCRKSMEKKAAKKAV